VATGLTRTTLAPREKKTAAPGESAGYGEVVKALEEVVQRLESGELSLEASLEAFEQGIGLVRRGEKLLKDAERRVEELLAGEGEGRTVPLATSRAPGAVEAPGKRATAQPGDDGEDVAF